MAKRSIKSVMDGLSETDLHESIVRYDDVSGMSCWVHRSEDDDPKTYFVCETLDEDIHSIVEIGFADREDAVKWWVQNYVLAPKKERKDTLDTFANKWVSDLL